MENRLPKWVVWWLGISTIIVVWDALFVLFRPASMPGEALGWIWDFAYIIYLAVDHSYADLTNHTVEAICLMSLFEACLVSITLIQYKRQHHNSAVVLATVVTSLTCAKTILFFLIEAFSGFAFIGHNEVLPLLAFYVIPNGLWIIVPGTIAVKCGRQISQWQPA